jgi:WD40 repeat protein
MQSEMINEYSNPFRVGKNPFMNNQGMEQREVIQEGEIQNNRVRPKFLYDITGAHNATVNIVRFSPNGQYLATGGDDSAIVIWVQKSRPIEFGSNEEKITWSNHKIMRGHLSDIYDICWSSDSKYLISGSVDNSAIVWSVEKAKGIQKFNDHSHFVQGVSWDPKNKYVMTQSSDKSVRVYKNAQVKQDIKFFFANMIKRYTLESGTNTQLPTGLVKENYQEDNMMIVDTVQNNSNMVKEKKSNPNAYSYYFADEQQCATY